MNSYNTSSTIVIDFVDCIWKLLIQWKAVLILCIMMALIVSGAKYYKDSNSYKNSLSEARKEASLSAEERIDAIIESLPEDQRDAVLFIVQEQELIDLQNDYLNNSILLNANPAMQRQLSIDYLLKSDGAADMRTLADAYTSGLHRESFLDDLRSVISPDAKIEYISELVKTNNTDIEYGDADSAILTVTVSLPDDTEADDIAAMVESAVISLNHELAASAGAHTVSRSNIKDLRVYDEDVVERRGDTTDGINTLNQNIEVSKKKLNETQLAACESIIAIKHSGIGKEDKAVTASVDQKNGSSTTADKPKAPVFSKKYALLGFILGALIYAAVYVVTLILRKEVTSVSVAQKYTGTRILGELYRVSEHKGLDKLFVSNMVIRLRYKDKLDISKQIDALASTVDAVCTHHDAKKILLLLSGVNTVSNDLIERIVQKCNAIGNKKDIGIINADEIDEKTLASCENAVYVLCEKTKADKLTNLISLTGDYDVTMLGSVYLENL